MARIGRLVVKNEQAVYHVMSRTALDGYPLGDLEKEFLVDVIRKKSRIYFVDVLGYCIMGNHFHLLVRKPALQMRYATAVRKLCRQQ